MWSNAAPRFHFLAWLLWLCAAMFAALSTRNPIYLSIITACALLVSRQLGMREAQDRESTYYAEASSRSAASRRLLFGTVVAVTVSVALLKGISLHLGATVLFTLPEAWPVIGGPVTLEALMWAALDAFSLLAVLAVFAAFSAGADYYAILRSIPPFMHQVGLITSIAITFVPKTIERFIEIREAQALRGHRVRRVGDLLPLIIPLLAGGMERSLNLAEAMEARGFSRDLGADKRLKPVISQLGLAIGLGLILVGGTIQAFASTIELVGWATVISGVIVIAIILWATGKGNRRVRYRRSVWRGRDTALSALSIGVTTFLITYRLIAPSTLVYYPFPRISPPSFDIIIAGALTTLAAPVLILVLSAQIAASKRLIKSNGKQSQRIRSTRGDPNPPRGTSPSDPTTHTGHVRE